MAAASYAETAYLSNSGLAYDYVSREQTLEISYQNIPRSTSLNCANLEPPPGRPPCGARAAMSTTGGDAAVVGDSGLRALRGEERGG
jgi:hypothetical protein